MQIVNVRYRSDSIIGCRFYITDYSVTLPMESNGSRQDQQPGKECIITPEPDTSDVPYPQDAFRNVTSAEAAGKIGVTSLVMALALLGNCLVVTTVWRCRCLRTPTNVYIVSLAVSDLMVTLSCTWVHLVMPGSSLPAWITWIVDIRIT